jgi:hypothetical protein
MLFSTLNFPRQGEFYLSIDKGEISGLILGVTVLKTGRGRKLLKFLKFDLE